MSIKTISRLKFSIYGRGEHGACGAPLRGQSMSEISKSDLRALLCEKEICINDVEYTNIDTRLLAHLRMEAMIGYQYKLCTFAHWVFYVYWAEIVFRNYAFLRVERAVRLEYMQPHRLYDFGHEITSGVNWVAFGDVFAEKPLYVLTVYCLFLPLLSFVLCSRPIYLNLIFSRYALLMTTGHAFRFLCYASTTLPGSADHCVAADASEFLEVHASRVRHDNAFWFMPPEPPGNCGDLIFSGHMILLVFTCKVGAQYTIQLIQSNNDHNFIPLLLTRLAFGIVFVLQILGTLSKRNHYTVDILLGVFVAHFLDEKIQELLCSTMFKHPDQASLLWGLIGASPLVHISARASYAVKHLF